MQISSRERVLIWGLLASVPNRRTTPGQAVYHGGQGDERRRRAQKPTNNEVFLSGWEGDGTIC